MTVSELIEELRRWPPDSHVVIGEGDKLSKCRIRYEELLVHWYGSSEQRKVTAVVFKKFEEKGAEYNYDRK